MIHGTNSEKDNYDNESSDDDNNDDDVEKDEEDEENEEHLASVDPSVVPIDDHETMTTVNQGYTSRVSVTEEVSETCGINRSALFPNARLRKEKLNNTSKTSKPTTAEQRLNTGCNIVGHLVRNCRRPTNDNQRGTGTSQKVNCYECGNQGHYKRDCPERNNQSHKNQIKGTGAHECAVLRGGETDQDPNNIKDEIEA
ncbi:putative reverse transcriptase domain-containing protein [Tanacetum coccineum]